MNHRSATCLLGLAALTGLVAAPAIAAASGVVHSIVEETAKGKITAVELDYHNFTIEVKGKEVRIFITEDTKYTVGGKPGKKGEALKVGAKVKVTHTDNIAANVEVE